MMNEYNDLATCGNDIKRREQEDTLAWNSLFWD